MDASQIELLDELLDCEAGLTDWELKFIEDMDKKRGLHLTPKQAAKLEKIHEEKVP